MAIAYYEPGVRVSETVAPNIAPLLASPANVCLVGRAQGFQTRTDQIVLADVAGSPVAVSLSGLPAGAAVQSVLSVKDALDPSKGQSSGGGYTVTTDYTVSTVNATVTRVNGGAIADGTIVNVEYTYLPENYFTPTRYDNFAAVEAAYGPAYSTDGNSIGTDLSYAAQLAFENGAATVICQPLFARTTPGNPATAPVQPSAGAQTASVVTWQDTLYALRDYEDINVVVPVIGQNHSNVTDAAQLSILKAFQDHVQHMRLNDQYLIAVLGEDSSTSVSNATQATLRTHAADLRARYAGLVAQQTVFIEPSRFGRISPVTGRRITVGGQYVAAAVAGMLAARPVNASLTRKQVSGFSEVLVPRLKQDKNVMAAAGFMVIEQVGLGIRVRHAVTLDNNTTATRELNVVRAKHRVIESVRDTLDTQIIGEVIADDAAPLVTRSAVIGVLEALVGDGDIIGYRNVDARTLSLDPTTIEVRFSYRPAFAVNYVNVVFSLDLTGEDGLTVQT